LGSGLTHPGPTSCLIHRSAWKKNSANFAFWAFCELRHNGFSGAAEEMGGGKDLRLARPRSPPRGRRRWFGASLWSRSRPSSSGSPEQPVVVFGVGALHGVAGERFGDGDAPDPFPPVVSQILARLDWGVQPPDLDAHLSGPDPGTGGRFHLYYNNRLNPPVNFVALDQDNTAHGPNQPNTPETITISPQAGGVFVAGDYHLWVHNYTLSGPSVASFDGSNAVLTVLTGDAQGNVLQVGRYEVVNAVGTQADDLWHVVDLTINANGNVVPNVVQTLQAVPAGVDGDGIEL
jgi:hypothetical protein